MVPVKQRLVISDRDVTGQERFFVLAEGLVGEARAVVKVVASLEEALKVAEGVKAEAVSIVKQVGYGFWVR
jgi:hypothetical protein